MISSQGMELDCYWPIVPFLSLCTVYILFNTCSHHEKRNSIKKFVFNLAPLVMLLCWIQVSKYRLQDLQEETWTSSEMKELQVRVKEHRNVFYILLLITIARAVTLVRVTLLIELAWICCIGMLIKIELNHLKYFDVTSFVWMVAIVITLFTLCMNTWILAQWEEEDELSERQDGFQYQTVVSGGLILGGLSVILGLNIIQVLSAPGKDTILNEAFALFLYASTVLHLVMKHCCPILKICSHNICFILSQAAYLSLVLLVVCKD